MIFLVRHGEAAAGWGDHPDPGLSTLGQAQAETVSEALLARGTSSVIASPMQRCRETAAPLAAHLGVDPAIVPAVSEIVTPEDVSDRVSWLRGLMAGDWPDVMSDWRGSALAAIDALPDGTAVFSHFVAINAIIGQLSGTDKVLVFRPAHCSVTVLRRDASGRLGIDRLGDEAASRVL